MRFIGLVVCGGCGFGFLGYGVVYGDVVVLSDGRVFEFDGVLNR